MNEASNVQLLSQKTLRIVFPLLRLFCRRDLRHDFFLLIDDAIEKRCFSVVPYPRGKGPAFRSNNLQARFIDNLGLLFAVTNHYVRFQAGYGFHEDRHEPFEECELDLLNCPKVIRPLG